MSPLIVAKASHDSIAIFFFSFPAVVTDRKGKGEKEAFRDRTPPLRSSMHNGGGRCLLIACECVGSVFRPRSEVRLSNGCSLRRRRHRLRFVRNGVDA